MTPDSTLPMPTPEAAPHPTAPRSQALAIRFTGSGSEYFRIWSVNLLLTLVTLGIYFPWAKARRLRYFYGNTLVGDHPLDFHGRPGRMLRGYLLVGALVGLYSVAGKVSPTAGLIALLILAGVWPALFRASQQFRLANTSWRGLRFRFTGGLAGAYRAVLPAFVPALLALAGVVAAHRLDDDAAPGATSGWLGLLGLVPLAVLLLFPLLWWLLKKYQHDHSALGQTQPTLRVGPGAFYAVIVKTVGVALLTGLVGVGVGLLLGGGGAMALLAGKGGSQGSAPALVAMALAVVAFLTYIAMIMVVRPYAVSRFQNLVWGRTASAEVGFTSTLRFWPMLGLTVKNWALVLATLGLYWPFAAVAMARMRLSAVSVQMHVPVDALVARTERSDDAAGDAAGDLFGIDIGL